MKYPNIPWREMAGMKDKVLNAIKPLMENYP